jgi:hypothetical protein
MKEKLNQFIDNTNGQFIEVSSNSALYQCMDLCYLWVFALGFPKATIQNQYAYQAFANPKEITYQYFDLIPNTPDGIPQDGDIVVWKATSGNVAGHIAVALGGGTTSKFKCFEQNSPLGTSAHVGEKSYTNVLGWLRPKIQESSVTEPNWFKTLQQEAGLSLEREGEFRTFWDKAKRYDDDVRSLQEQIKSANEALADRALEVSLLTEKNQKLSDAKTEAEEQLNKTRGDRDKAIWDKDKAEALNKTLLEENDTLNAKIEAFKSENSLYGYSWVERLLSLFKRGQGGERK